MNERRVSWSYWHHLNSVSAIRYVKRGVFHGQVRHTKRYWRKDGARQLAVVHFDGNKHSSRVPFCDLVFEEVAQ